MEKKELKELIRKMTHPNHEVTDRELAERHSQYAIDGKWYDVYMAGDMMLDIDFHDRKATFYQVGIDPKNDMAYKFFVEPPEEARFSEVFTWRGPYRACPIPDIYEFCEEILQ